jgi:hypothetical protein
MKLGPVELFRYFEPSERVGRFVVGGRINFTRVTDGVAVRPTEAALARIVDWCAAKGMIRYEEVLKKQFGELPLGLEGHRMLNRQVFLYDPDQLPGLHELDGTPFTTDEHGAHMTGPCLVPTQEFVIDGSFYVVCMASMSAEDFEEPTSQ